MLRKFAGILTSALMLNGCSTFQDIEEGLNNFRGQHISELYAHIGYPKGSLKLPDVGSPSGFWTAYVWDTRQQVSMTLPQTTYNTGTFNYGGQMGTFGGSSTTWVTQTGDFWCRLTVTVGPTGYVNGFSYEGNIGGCEYYARPLRRIKK